jgi:hypothetical protein
MHDSSERRSRIDVHLRLAVWAPCLTLRVTRAVIALIALATTLACAAPAGASGLTVYGGQWSTGTHLHSS